MRLRAALAVALAGVAVAVPACSGAVPPPDPALVAGWDTGTAGVRAPSSTAGGTLELVTGAVDSLDPARSYSPGVWNLMRLYTRQLVTFGTAPGDAGAVVVPDLATALGRTSDGGRTWTYTLRPGLRWEDGRPVTSRDVKYGIERLFASDVLAGGPSWAVGLLDDPKAPYDGPYTDRTPGRLGLPSVRTPDDRTVQFRLTRPFADWDKVLALPAASPVAANGDTVQAYAQRPASSGPYRIVRADAREVLFERNRYWSRSVDPVRPALPDRVRLAVGLVPAERDRRLLTGAADADLSGSGLQPDAAARALADPALTARLDDPTTGTVRFVAMPASVPPLGDVHCRRAVQYALDKAAAKEALGGERAAALATTLWPRSLPGYPASAPYPGGAGNSGDLAAARAELARCGRPGGFGVTLGTVDDGRAGTLAGTVTVALGRVGIAVTVRRYPRADFLSAVAGDPAAVRRDGLGLLVGEWAADFPSPDAFLVPLVDGRSVRAGSNPNLAGLTDPALSRAVDRAAATPGRVRGLAGWRQVLALAMDTAGYAPVVEDRALLLGSARLRNAYVHSAFRGYDVVALGVG